MANVNEKEFWQNAERILLVLLNRYSIELDDDSRESVQHYLDHSEYEMAFEGLFIELMALKLETYDIEFNSYVELGKVLGLKEESIFDADFWMKFISFTTKYNLDKTTNSAS